MARNWPEKGICRKKSKRNCLRKELNSGEISRLRPFGKTLQYGLDNAKIDPKDGYALWIEEDYCPHPLAKQREADLNRFLYYQCKNGFL